MFNINKYKGRKFHENMSASKKIEALFLLYDKMVDDKHLEYHDRIKLINFFLADMILFEEYEVAQAFKTRKFRKYKKWREERRGDIPIKLSLRLLRFKMSKWFRNLF